MYNGVLGVDPPERVQGGRAPSEGQGKIPLKPNELHKLSFRTAQIHL